MYISALVLSDVFLATNICTDPWVPNMETARAPARVLGVQARNNAGG